MRYIGIDNGTSGSLACLAADGTVLAFRETPTFEEQDYTKAKKRISRIDVHQLELWLMAVTEGGVTHAFLERPMVMPARFMQSLSAVRAHEATLIAVAAAHLPLQIVDSRQWQAQFLPEGTKGSTDLKRASREIGYRLWPDCAARIAAQGDADALFIAEYARRNRL